MHQEIIVKTTKKHVDAIDKVHASYAKKMSVLEKENQEAMVKLQKDSSRDMIENFKNMMQDLDVAIGLETPQDVKKK